MPQPEANSPPPALAVREARELSDSKRQTRSVRSSAKHWQPPEGLSPEEVRAVIAAASCERDRLLLRVLWATRARISEVLPLRSRDVRRDSLVLSNRKNPNCPSSVSSYPEPSLGSRVRSCYGPKSKASPITNHCSSRASTAPTGRARHSNVARRGSSSRRPPIEQMFVCWPSEPQGMVRLARRLRSILICSAMRACARSCVKLKACHSLSVRPVGRACNLPI